MSSSVIRVLQRRHHAGFDQRLRHVRTHDVPALGDLPDPFERDRVAELLKLADHQLAPAEAVGAKALQLRREVRVRSVHEVTEDVNSFVPVQGRELHAGDDLHAELPTSREGLVQPSGRVVIGDGHRVQPAFARQRDGSARRIRAVGVDGMRVKVDTGHRAGYVLTRLLGPTPTPPSLNRTQFRDDAVVAWGRHPAASGHVR